MNALEVVSLNKYYKSTQKQALDDVTLSVKEGIVFGLLGPNGAGKSTLIKAINNLIKLDKGCIKILGKNIDSGIEEIGYMPEDASMYDFLTGREFIEAIGYLRGIPKNQIESQMAYMSKYISVPNLDTLISSYSKGNKEKILFIATVIHKPKVLILDEPFTGYDPVAIYNVKRFIMDYSKLGNTVILSTHILEIVSQLCEEVAILKAGKVQAQFPVDILLTAEDRFIEIEKKYMEEVEGEVCQLSIL